ncbi:MAG: hypothetical protein ACSHXK_11775 [Oceanococcus sp.]
MSQRADNERLEGRTALRAAATTIIEQSERELNIASAALEPSLFNSQELIDTLKYRLLERRRMRVRLLISDPRPARRNADRLLALVRRLSSQFEIHQPSRREYRFEQDLWIGDTHSFLKRESPSALYAMFNPQHSLQAKTFKDEFEQAWLKSVNSPEFRQLS